MAYEEFDQSIFFTQLSDFKGSEIAIIDSHSNIELTWRELEENISKCGAWLSKMLPAGHKRIAVILPNSIDAAILFLTAMKFGCDYLPIDPGVPATEVQKQINQLSVDLLITCSASIIDDSLIIEHFRLASELNNFQWSSMEAEDLLNSRSSEGKLLIRTSGSTGEPKTLQISGNTLWKAGRVFCNLYDVLQTSPRFLNYLPMSYLGGIFNLLIIPLVAKGSCVISRQLNGANILKIFDECERHDIDVIWLTPTILRSLLKLYGNKNPDENKRKAQGIKLALIGTARCSSEEKLLFEETFDIPIYENYGLTETTFITSEVFTSDTIKNDRGIGKILPWLEVKIVPDTDVDFGALWVKTPFLFEGYWDANNKFTKVPPNEFFDTGDVGQIVDGNLKLVGRKKDIIKKGGVLINLAEIETQIKNLNIFDDVATLPIPHEFYSEHYVLFIVDNKTSPNKELEALVISKLSEVVDRDRYPERIIPCVSIPQTSSGKKSLPKLKLLYEAMKSAI